MNCIYSKMDTFWALPLGFVVFHLVQAQCPLLCKCSSWTINCHNAQLTAVPGGELPTDIMRFDLSNNKITTLYNNSFVVELASVEILLLANNSIRYIEMNSLEIINNLNFLDLSGNDIGFIPPEIFRQHTNLMGLILSNNPNLKLPDDGYNLPQLIKLDLDQCRIKQIPPNFFKNMNNIIFLYMHTNELSFLDPTHFKHLTKLEELDLSDNWFTVFQREFTELHSSTKLRISKNPWICNCDFITALEFFERSRPNKPPICKSPNQLRGLVANKTLINELFHCNPTKTTTTTTTTSTEGVFYGAFMDADLYEYDDWYEDSPVKMLPHVVGPVLKTRDVIDSSRPHSVVNTTDDDGQILFAGVVEYDSSWLEENQWWIYCAAIILLAAVVVTIINKRVNTNRKRCLLTNENYNDDMG